MVCVSAFSCDVFAFAVRKGDRADWAAVLRINENALRDSVLNKSVGRSQKAKGLCRDLIWLGVVAHVGMCGSWLVRTEHDVVIWQFRYD